jgi:hypothetical protein
LIVFYYLIDYNILVGTGPVLAEMADSTVFVCFKVEWVKHWSFVLRKAGCWQGLLGCIHHYFCHPFQVIFLGVHKFVYLFYDSFVRVPVNF